ncbi:putative Mitogen-activated protein kinase kinase 1 [Blattamonas nauphoetae]|uniref:non-specific serine/threonine protein kinase n=1 Tax=Blattamonas nauphoetae TaxID=2049346 RepID=A0ABQ9XFH5_9EUKA|nr:putative Mitogen-activated protein kinase kinase 1 [Blattamonas nauphoetae]
METPQVFTVLKVLGKGSYGTVELLEHIATKKTFACKSAQLSTNPDALKSVEEEIEAYRDIYNPYVLKYYFSFKEGPVFYMMTEYCSQKDLQVFYREARNLKATVPRDRTWKFIYQSLIGLDYLLKKRISHGDIKPENIFLMENLDVRLGDFGSKQDAEATFTALNDAKGTENFLSPQRRFYDPIARKALYGLSDDLWAFGIAIHYVLSKSFPYVTDRVPNMKIQSSIHKLSDTHADPDLRDFTYFILDTNANTRPTTQDLLLSPNFSDLFKNSDEGLKIFYTTDADFSIRQESREIVFNPELPQPFQDYVGYIHFLSQNKIETALFSSEAGRFMKMDPLTHRWNFISDLPSTISLHFLPTTNNNQLVLTHCSSHPFTNDIFYAEAATFWLHSSLAQHPQILETFREAFSSQIASSAQFVHSLPLLHRNSLLSHPAFPFGVVHNALTTPSQTSINGSSFLSNFLLANKDLIQQYVSVLSNLVDHFAGLSLDPSADKSKKKANQPSPLKVYKFKLKHVHLHLFHAFTALPLESFLQILHTTNLTSLLNKILTQHLSPWMVKNSNFVKSALSLINSFLMKFESSLLLPEITPPELARSWNSSIPPYILQQIHHFTALLHAGLNNAFSVFDVFRMVWTIDNPPKLREELQVLVINLEIADLLLHSERILKKTTSLLTNGAQSFASLAVTRIAEIETFTRSSTEIVGTQFRSKPREDEFNPKYKDYPWQLTQNSIVHLGLTPPVLIHVLGQRVMKQLGKKSIPAESTAILHLIRWIQDAIVWRDARRHIEWDRPVETSVGSLTRNEKDEYASLLHETLCSYATLLNEQPIGEIERVWELMSVNFIAIVGRVIASVLNSLSPHLVQDWMNLIKQPLDVIPTPTTPLQNANFSPAFAPSNSPHVTHSPVVHPSNFNPVNQIPQVSMQQTMNLPYQQPNPQFHPNQQFQQQPNQQFHPNQQFQPNYGYHSQQLIQPQQIPNPTIVNTFSTSAPTVLNAVPPPTLMQTVRANQAPIQHVPPQTLMSTVQASQFPPSHVPPPTIVATVRGNPLANNPVPQPNTFGLGFQSPPSPMPTSPVVPGHYNPHAVQHSPLQNTYAPVPQPVQHSPLQNTFNPVAQTSPGYQTMQGSMQQNNQYLSNIHPQMGRPTGMPTQVAVQPPSVTSIAPSELIQDFITLPATHLLSVSTPFLALLSLFFEKAQSSTHIMSSLAPLFAFLCRSVTVIVQSLNKLDVAAPKSAETRSCLYQLLSSYLSCLTQFMKQPQIAPNFPAARTTPHFILFTQTLFDDFVMSIAKLPELSEAWNNRNTSPSFRPLSSRDTIIDEAAESFNSFVTNYVSLVSAFSQFSSFFETVMRQNNAFVTSLLNSTPEKQAAFRNGLTTLADWAKKMSADCSESILSLHPTLQLTPFSSSPLRLEGEQVSPLAHRYYLLKCFGDSIQSAATQCLLNRM